ncbi:fimbrial biogenesis chaperone [Vibrio comitans]|uniref:Pili assembly chaperone N-terminal domain-containing protein n=1 Tax=Vibrio comitans NBRC 102076 TaxID=1219078 RepID=A0A4Y3IMW9_9VIBR|nr:fimbria/pilus periplasmic chaperone [Vibrio comitans]GEA60841.1 hypothetical protein VCO01S_20340 [Vibrio comitans NBRC 102076]
MKQTVTGLCLLLIAHCVWAIQLSPMFHLLDAAGAGSMNSYQVFNPSDTDVFIDISITKINGSEQLPSDDDFLILPPQGRIPPNSAQRFRIRYLGDMPTQTTLYRVTFEQVNPVELSDDQSSSVALLFKFSTSVMVSPLDCNSNINVDVESKSVKFLNTGNCVFDMSETQFELSGEAGSEVIGWEDFQSGAGGYLMPGRNVFLKLPDSLAKYKEVRVIGQ